MWGKRSLLPYDSCPRYRTIASLLVPVMLLHYPIRKLSKRCPVFPNDLIHVRLQEESKSFPRNISSVSSRCDVVRCSGKSTVGQDLKGFPRLEGW
jgi:hypothetical protein